MKNIIRFKLLVPCFLALYACGLTPDRYLDLNTFTEIPRFSEAEGEGVLLRSYDLTAGVESVFRSEYGLGPNVDLYGPCQVDTNQNTLTSPRDLPPPQPIPYTEWTARWRDDMTEISDNGVFVLRRGTYHCTYVPLGGYQGINYFLGALQALNIPFSDGQANNRTPVTASALKSGQTTDEIVEQAAPDSGSGIGRALASVATGAVMADAVMRGADPEDVAQLGGQVIDMIEGDNTTTATARDSGFQGFELPDENRREVFGDAPPVARVAQSASGGQCEFPWMLDDSPPPTDITAIRLSWCNASDTSTLHLRANAAATQQCQLVYWKQDGRPAEDIDGLSRTIRQACAYANELSDGACRCPDWYGR